ncbi:MAG: ATP-binding protein [Candidatus Micrarchaeota archaeon]|mgnify:CR=1 FL=1
MEFNSVENSLKKLSLLEDKYLTNTAVLLFAEQPEKFIKNAKLRCAVFAGADTTTAIDMKEYVGDVLYLIEEAQKYLLKNIHIGMRIAGLVRVDVPEINEEALREAIINAFCHRDYYNDDSVNIAVFSDRVEIRSPGLLYGGLTIERIRNEKISERRNDLLADMLHRIHYIEKWGQGISKMLSKEPSVSFKEVGRQFITVFKRQEKTSAVEKTREKTREKILALIKSNPSITTDELADKLKLTTKGIEWQVSRLKSKGVLKRIGPDKGGHWGVLKE